MKRIFSVNISESAVNIALLLLRVSVGILMANHGYQKLTHFEEMQANFMDFLGLGFTVSLILTIGAEFFCSLLLIAGLLTRLALVPLIIAMTVAVLSAHGGDIFGKGEHALLYVVVYVALFLTGPGKLSADNFIFK
jgi:putative oxidoreductase